LISAFALEAKAGIEEEIRNSPVKMVEAMRFFKLKILLVLFM
jgi:hypothetical protein